jgi:hypothetical protein
MRRALSVVALCALPISIVSVGFAGTASAASAAAATVTCKKLSGSVTGTANLTKCNDTTATGGKGSFPAADVGTGSGTITWGSKGTTPISGTATSGGTACPAGDTEYVFSGTTGKSKGAAKSIKKGLVVTADACLSATDTLSLAPGTDFTIG